MRVGIVVAGLVAIGTAGFTAQARQQPSGATDDEVKAHVQSLQRRIDDPSVDVTTRERLSMEAAATLDRAAQATSSGEARRARWTEAVAVLDRFREANPGHPLSRQFEVQAAIYLWAKARSWVDPARTVLADATTRSHAVDDLEASLLRLRPVVNALGGANDLFAQNARFRLAQALADLAEVGSAGPDTRKSHNEDALAALERLPTEPSLQAFGRLLRASLLVRLGRFTEAQADVAAAMSKPLPPELDLLEVRVAVLSGLKQTGEARKAIDASRLDPASKLALRVRVGLDDLKSKPSGAEREAAEAALFRDLKALRATKRPEVRLALVSAASAVREPGPSQEPEAWDLLADGSIALGDPSRAAVLSERAADRAEVVGNSRLAAEYRLKAGAALFQAGKFAQADVLLTRVAEDAKAGEVRPRASLLRALSRGRWLAEGKPGASSGRYAAALQYQAQTFPNDPSTAEARWLLGRLRLAESDGKAACQLWEAIPHGAQRWLESRVEIARVRQDDLDALRINGDPELTAKRLAEARLFLKTCLDQARTGEESNALSIARARLELTPVVGQPEDAQRAAETVLRSVARPAERQLARGSLMIALAQLSRFVEAEQIARQDAGSPDADPSSRRETLRVLDRAASEADSDLKMRRMGLLMSTLVRPLVRHADGMPASLLAEIKLREIRGLLFSGADDAARRAVTGWSASSLSTSPELLRDLADTYTRLDAYELAADVQRLRAKVLPSGSPAWFDARYGLALAYYRSGKPSEALSLIDGTTILHPDLGGGELRNRFIRLRQRIAPNP